MHKGRFKRRATAVARRLKPPRDGLTPHHT